MNLGEIRDAYLAEGLSYLDASAKTCQDTMLALIAKSPLARNVTIKGGVVMQHLSKDRRRATQDFDFDFIRYSLSDQSIRAFISKLGEQSSEISVSIVADMEELRHQDYKGKRVYIRITDSFGIGIDTKLDIGVHKFLSMEQDVFCFDLSKLDDSVSLLINTKEQIFTEKLKGFLRLGNLSTRYKDIYDMYWLITVGEISRAAIQDNVNLIVFNDMTMRENCNADIISRLSKAFADPLFIASLRDSKRYNWLEIDPLQATNEIIGFIQGI